MKFKGKKAIMAAALSAIVAASSFGTAITASARNTYWVSSAIFGSGGETILSKGGTSPTASEGDSITVTATPYPGHYIRFFLVAFEGISSDDPSVHTQETVYRINNYTSGTLTYTFTMPATNVLVATDYGKLDELSTSTPDPTPTPTPTPEPTPTWKRGDVNLDGYVNAKDATAVLKHVVGLEKLTGQKLINVDVNGDGYINAKDATEILKIVIGLA